MQLSYENQTRNFSKSLSGIYSDVRWLLNMEETKQHTARISYV